MTQPQFNITDFSALDNGPGGIANSHLKDGEHKIIRCSNCDKALCDAWITQPKLDVTSKIVAKCDYCDDKSYPVTIRGKFHIGHTEDSNMVDLKFEFLDAPKDASGIYQKVEVITKRK